MSVKVVREEIARFLESESPEVLAIRGKWGIGKTYAWKKILKEQKKLGKVKLTHYSYVSLFGVSSLQDLKESLFQNMVSNDLIGEKIDVRSCATSIKDSLEAFGRKSAKSVSEFISKISKYTQSISNITSLLSFITVRDSIICIDDFERKGDFLSLKEILGLMSQLKEERNCKIVLIYNDEYLEAEKKIYDELKEKVIDAEILYSPLPEESISVALYDRECEDIHQIIKKCSIKLNINNIRILMKIKRLSLILKKELYKYDPKIIEQAVNSVTLFCYIFYSKSEYMPDYDWIKKYNIATPYIVQEENKDKNAKEIRWCEILADYGYLNTDQLDLVIHEGVSSGYFNREKLIEEAEKLSALYNFEHNNLFKKAWELYHNDLSDNQGEFIQKVTDGFLQHIKILSVMDLSSTVIVLRKLKQDDLANKLIDSFADSRKSDLDIFNLSESFCNEKTADQYLVSKFNSIWIAHQKPKSFQEIIQRVVETSSWNQEDVKYLSDIDVNNYLSYFKSLESPFLRKAIKLILQLNINNARQALIKIAEESPLNALRLSNYGINLDFRNSSI
jgi:hypothetical protein